MIDTASVLVFAPGCMAPAFELPRELIRSVAPTGTGQVQELARNEVPGMRCHNVEEAGSGLGVAEGFDGSDIVLFDLHRLRISAVSSRWSSTRRKRSASPREAYRENPARTFSAKWLGR